MQKWEQTNPKISRSVTQKPVSLIFVSRRLRKAFLGRQNDRRTILLSRWLLWGFFYQKQNSDWWSSNFWKKKKVWDELWWVNMPTKMIQDALKRSKLEKLKSLLIKPFKKPCIIARISKSSRRNQKRHFKSSL